MPLQQRTSDPHRNLFWMFISFMGISIPKPGQERRAMRMLIIGVVAFLLFVAAGMLTVFRLW
jgi:lipopolysaccharide export LptBFGC system permease protein LptF